MHAYMETSIRAYIYTNTQTSSKKNIHKQIDRQHMTLFMFLATDSRTYTHTQIHLQLGAFMHRVWYIETPLQLQRHAPLPGHPCFRPNLLYARVCW